jgi:hypothetical protein
MGFIESSSTNLRLSCGFDRTYLLPSCWHDKGWAKGSGFMVRAAQSSKLPRTNARAEALTPDLREYKKIETPLPTQTRVLPADSLV